ncbi:hypothetical protein Hypma_003310 [Hypsizygus marmoreus]|uniref:WSC domain-containing protein n=1 Tax=Hypsizygus marmoreus TaxID=39966 RepID=A0A369K4D2_HYPMA|nr:hypothetical protein Hypma_003310 [Hypsizygus marmoreus]
MPLKVARRKAIEIKCKILANNQNRSRAKELCGLELPISLLKTHHSGGLTTLSFPPILQIPIESITVETCIGACKAGGYYIARLRYGQECWCDAKT